MLQVVSNNQTNQKIGVIQITRPRNFGNIDNKRSGKNINIFIKRDRLSLLDLFNIHSFHLSEKSVKRFITNLEYMP